MRLRPAAIAVLAAACAARPAPAHEAGGGFILLMPTGVWITGAALAVAATFLALALVPDRVFAPPAPAPPASARIRALQDASSLLSCGAAVFLLFAALAGKDDPLANPAPLAVWTLGWILMTPAVAVFGNLWLWANPWTGLLRLFGLGARPLLRLPAWPGILPAVLQLCHLIWIDLISLHATDPERLFRHLLAYLAVNGAAMALFGIDVWSRRGEPLSVLFRLLSALSPLRPGSGRWLVLPGAEALVRPPLGRSETAFIVILLAAGTFDGIAATFRWLAATGINPLEFPGRSAVIWTNTAGLAATAGLLAAGFLGALALGRRLAGQTVPLAAMAAASAWSLLPIYVAYLVSHFAMRIVMDLQYLWKTASDPLGRGWDLFGTAAYFPSQSLFGTEAGVHLIWSCQVAAITLGHGVAVLMAHGAAVRLFGGGRAALRAGLPLAVLMVGYTWLGLALLAMPRI
ncbi:hypothetical protein [Mangrovicoccus sp. HB161399]|uniref:hypothetical protein n=1 Tax=Mangrovicoccus sp. HB161399 TaxID=2720392 RepID=UPI00155164C7|nr:hypothetical protein [Mangrovicoccus sp. HB161399]